MEIKKVYEVGVVEDEKFVSVLWDYKQDTVKTICSFLRKENSKIVMVETTRRVILDHE